MAEVAPELVQATVAVVVPELVVVVVVVPLLPVVALAMLIGFGVGGGVDGVGPGLVVIGVAAGATAVPPPPPQAVVKKANNTKTAKALAVDESVLCILYFPGTTFETNVDSSKSRLMHFLMRRCLNLRFSL